MAVVSLSLNVLQDTVGDILLGGIRREVTICLGNMLAISPPICLYARYLLKFTTSIALMCLSDAIMPSLTTDKRDFSSVWVVRLMSSADAIICLSSPPGILILR